MENVTGTEKEKNIRILSKFAWLVLVAFVILLVAFVSYLPVNFNKGIAIGPIVLVLVGRLTFALFKIGVRVYDDRIEYKAFNSEKRCIMMSELVSVSAFVERANRDDFLQISFTKRNGTCGKMGLFRSLSSSTLDAFEHAFSRVHSLSDADAPEIDLHLHFDDNVDRVSIKHNGLPIHDDGTYAVKAKVGDWLSFTTKRSAFFYSIVDTTHTEFLIRMNNPYLSVRMTTKEGV